MARVTEVAKARKSPGNCRKCGRSIQEGESYKWFANLLGRTSIKKIFCSSCRIRQSDMTTSDKLSTLYSAQETLEDSISSASSLEDLASALNDAANEAREVAESYRESVSNMPENLQNSSQCEEMNEKADNIENWADELEGIAQEIEGEDEEPEDEAECQSCHRPYSEHDQSSNHSDPDEDEECPNCGLPYSAHVAKKEAAKTWKCAHCNGTTESKEKPAVCPNCDAGDPTNVNRAEWTAIEKTEPDEDEECHTCGNTWQEHVDKTAKTEEGDICDEFVEEPKACDEFPKDCGEFEPEEDKLEEARTKADEACGNLQV